MKIRVYCDSGANIHSRREEVIDTVKHWNITDEEWEGMTDEERQREVEEWAYQRLEIGWTPVED